MLTMSECPRNIPPSSKKYMHELVRVIDAIKPQAIHEFCLGQRGFPIPKPARILYGQVVLGNVRFKGLQTGDSANDAGRASIDPTWQIGVGVCEELWAEDDTNRRPVSLDGRSDLSVEDFNLPTTVVASPHLLHINGQPPEHVVPADPRCSNGNLSGRET
jgi:hypothetical protein